MSLIDNVLKTAEKTVVSNIQNLKQQGIKKFVHDAGVDVNGMTQDALMAAYEDFKNRHLDELVNGEYLGKQAQQFGELLTYSAEEIKKQASTISIKGTKIDTQELFSNPQAALHNAAEAMVDKEIDKVVQDKVGQVLQQYGIISGDTKRAKDEVVDLIRNTIRGTKNSIFRNPDIKAGMMSIAEGAINDYYKSAVEMLENAEWQQKQLKPLNDMIDKGFSQLDDVQKKLGGQIDDINKKIDKLDEIAKMDLAKEINDQITGKLDINGRLADLNKKLGMFGLDQGTLNAIGGNLNNQIVGVVNQNLGPTIQNSIVKMGEISQRVAEVKQYVQKYEDFVKNEIKAFEDKAKEYIKQIETELINTVLSSVHLKLGGGIKLKF